jgi:hypothetical protein
LPCEFDAGECAYCGRSEPAQLEPESEYPDAWISLALEDAYSMGGDA